MDDMEVLALLKGRLHSPTGQNWFDGQKPFTNWLNNSMDLTDMHPEDYYKAVTRLVNKGYLQVSSPILDIVLVETKH